MMKESIFYVYSPITPSRIVGFSLLNRRFKGEFIEKIFGYGGNFYGAIRFKLKCGSFPNERFPILILNMTDQK